VALVRSGGVAIELHALDGVPHPRVPVWLNAADAVVVTSVHEGSPNVVKEALACNVAVVSVDVGDVRERISGVQGCHLVEADAQDIADHLARVFESGRRVAGREVIEELSLSRVAERLSGIYAEVVARARRGAGSRAA
jgi:glycosyltransferase involved in cell wall biosynthesis